MDDAHAVRDGSAEGRGPEVSPSTAPGDCASRAADLSADLYARAERDRRKESLEELLSRDHGA